MTARPGQRLARAVKSLSCASSIVCAMDYRLLDYKLYRLGDSEAVDALEAHVLARAYDAAWRALYLCDPTGRHVIEALGLAIDFGPGERRRH